MRAEPVGAPVDLLIENANVVTVDGGNRVFANGAVAIRGRDIVAVGAAADVTERLDGAPGRVIDARGGIVLPGFVNLHTHLAMTLLRGWADDVDLQAFLDRVFPTEAAIVSPSTVRVGTNLAIAESLRAGITCSLDMYFHPEVTADAARQAGVRIANGPVIFSFPGPDHLNYPERIQQAESLLREAQAGGGLTEGRWVCAHGTYTIERDHLVEVHDLAERHGAGFTIHAAENAAEVATVVAQHGRRPVELLHDLGLLGPRTVLAHCVDLTGEEIAMIARSGASVAHNPLSNMKLGSGFAPVPELLEAGVRVGLGTDGAASSNDLDLYQAMRFAATIHKGRSGDATVVAAATALRMATIDGATALGLGDVLGSIEVGKRADLQILAADRPHLVPSYDPISTVVYAAGRGDVRTVLVDGHVVLDDFRLTTIDLERTIAEARQIAQSVRSTSRD